MRKEFLIWLDILGFDELAKEIAGRSGISERKVRDDFVRLINEKVEEAKIRGEIVGKKYGEGEDWLLVASSLDSVFKVVTGILDHNTEYKHYEKIPIEVGIGVGQYDRWARLDGIKLVVESPTIEFLKTHIIDFYREWHKQTYSKPIKSTFVVLTKSAYDEMEPLDKKNCRKIEYETIKNKGKKTKLSFFVIEKNKVIQRGKLLEFLERINKPASPRYRWIDRIFVPPVEYKSMIESLEKHKVVFLIGDPEIGKTYTAVRLLWEYYCKGYAPIWHSGSEISHRERVRQVMSDLEIPDNSVVYLEDPFGRIKFEDREELRRGIGMFINGIQTLDARVIVTSREEPFKEFEKEKLSQSDIRKLSIEMDLKKPSYSDEKKKEILLNWAKASDCQWLRQKELEAFVIEEGLKRLKTPLSLMDLTHVSKDYTDQSLINKLIEEKSKETRKAFAEEIMNMTKEKVMFLSIVYMLSHIKANKIQPIYDRTCKKFGIDPREYSFEYQKQWFESKIASDRQDAAFEFTHSSYEQGFVQSWSKAKIKTLYLDIVNELLKEEDPTVRGSCGFVLVKNFEEISFKEKARHLIEMVLEDENSIARYGVAYAIELYFGSIPFDLGLDYMKVMSSDRHREIRAIPLKIAGEYFGKIPFEDFLKFMSEGLEDRAAFVRLNAVTEVRRVAEKLPLEIVEKALQRCRELCSYSGWLISYFASILYEIFRKEVKKLKESDTSNRKMRSSKFQPLLK